MSKRILVVAHDELLRQTRASILKREGYEVVPVSSDDEGMAILERERFDLVLLGRRSVLPKTGVDQRIRERHPGLMILKIVPRGETSAFPSRLTEAEPRAVLEAIQDMLGDHLSLTEPA